MDAQDFKARRTEMKLTQAALATELGVTEATIANYESGRSDVPRAIELAIQMLFHLRIETAKNKRADFVESAKKYARAFALLKHHEMALIWTSEMFDGIETADQQEEAELLRIVNEAVDAESQMVRVWKAARKHREVLANLHTKTDNLIEKRALAEILKAFP
jgi:DNA-binding XRE family transcriptional regulator